MERLKDFADVVFEEALAGFSEHEHATLLALLDRVRANLSENFPDEALPLPVASPSAPAVTVNGANERLPHG